MASSNDREHYAVLVIGGRTITGIEGIIHQLAEGSHPLTERREEKPRPGRAEERAYFLGLGGYFPEEEKKPATKQVDTFTIPEQGDPYDNEFPSGSE